MIAIGIRAKPNVVYYSIISENDTAIEINIVDKIVMPQALEMPEQLKFLRGTLKDIINKNHVELGCIRITEPNARTVNISRIYMEGVVQELIASSSINKYYVGQISSISAKLEIPRDSFKPLASGRTVFESLDIWSEICLEERESILAAFSALKL